MKRLYVGNLNFSTTEDDIWREMIAAESLTLARASFEHGLGRTSRDPDLIR